MVDAPRWLALEVRRLDRARPFYESLLDLDVVAERERELRLAVGDAELRLRAPGDVPRGGVHTHYALSVPRAEYDDWYDRLDAADRSPVERRFGDARSVYCFDPDGHCVELHESDDATDGVDGLFEVVLEVEDLERALAVYETLGFDVVDRGAERRRVRTTSGPLDLELWEPQLGIADGQGGVHVDLGLAAATPSRLGREVAGGVRSVEAVDEGVRLRDEDGHYVTLTD